MFEYKSVFVSIDRKSGILKHAPKADSCERIERFLNKLGQEGWELAGVFPVSDGDNPAQTSGAIHHFKRPVID